MTEWTEPKYCLGCDEPESLCQCEAPRRPPSPEEYRRMWTRLEAAEKMAEAMADVRSILSDIPEANCSLAYGVAVQALAAWEASAPAKDRA